MQLEKPFLIIKKGKIYLWGVKGILMDAELFHYLDVELIKTFGFKKRSEILYNAAEKASLEGCKNLTSSPMGLVLKKISGGKKKLIEFLVWIVTNRTGWGSLKMVKYDERKLHFEFILKHSVIAKYFRTKNLVCHSTYAKFAGGSEAVFDRKFIAKEIKCEARGDPVCEIIVDVIR